MSGEERNELAYFEFYPANDKREWQQQRFFLRILFGPGKIEIKGGGGTWETVKRPYLQPLTVWRGPSEPLTYKIPFVLDAYDENNNTKDRAAGFGHSVIDQQRREINQLAGVHFPLEKHTGTLPEPPTLTLNANGTLPHDDTNEPQKHEWIISEPPEWGEWIRAESGLLLRQEGTITFQKHEAATDLERVNKPQSPPPNSMRHVSGRETYEEIAHHVLKHASWGTKLARLQRKPQPHQNARQTPKRGLIRWPTASEIRDWEHGR